MKVASILAAVLALTLCVSLANAKPAKVKPVNGSITKIDGTSITIQPKTPKNATDAPAPVVVTTTDATTVTIDGEKKAVSDLVVGQKVTVTLDTDGKTATAFMVGKKPKNAPQTATPPAAAPAAPAAGN